MSELLQNFYNDYWLWLQDGAREHPIKFRRSTGLCGNVHDWLLRNGEELETVSRIQQEMRVQFMNAGLHFQHPFNHSLYSYQREGEISQCHHNEQRIHWIREHIQ